VSHAGLRWCGIISYEWYLWHQPMIGYSRQFFGSAEGDVPKYAMILGVPLVLSIAVAAAAYRFVSLPILRFGRSRHRE
jgi:peptidoglycan/LPS O-acetylase OafA/YrhL